MPIKPHWKAVVRSGDSPETILTVYADNEKAAQERADAILCAIPSRKRDRSKWLEEGMPVILMPEEAKAAG